MRGLSLILGLMFLALAPIAGGEPVHAKHAQVELLSLETKARPDAKLLVGVHFVLEKGWHIYWINPGDSGQSPSFQWQLPEGFSAGSIEWPRPERMQSSSELTDYGYHDEVLLMVPIHAAQGIAPDGQALGFSVDAKWLICREICLPDHARLQGSWSVGGARKASPETVVLFARAKKLLPQPLPPGWAARVESRQDTFVLNLDGSVTGGRPQFFPLEPGQVENAAAQPVETTAHGLKITLKKSDLLLKPISVLRGVLVFAGGEAYQVEAPVMAAKGIK
ncbi:MAG TPA: protein-disulfide reductase DsbD domain-containing protein [Terriglobia bacterium]